MVSLIRTYGLFYLTATGTFFFLCAYSLATDAPNYPFLPALFFPLYLGGAISMSESKTDHPLMGILPVTPGEIMKVKFGLAFVFVLIGWLNMTFFTLIQPLDSEITIQVMKLNTICATNALLLAAILQFGIHFFGWPSFHKVIITFLVGGSIFVILFFIGLAESGRDHPGMFPLIPFLDSLPLLVVLVGVASALAAFYSILQRGPWGLEAETEGY